MRKWIVEGGYGAFRDQGYISAGGERIHVGMANTGLLQEIANAHNEFMEEATGSGAQNKVP